MQINDNSMDIKRYKGPISPCPLCSRQSPDAALDALTSGRACRLCFGKQFISHCLNCQGTGQYSGRTVWDGGRSEHKSTCTPCGGAGVYPAQKPKDWDDAKWAEQMAERDAVLCQCTHPFGKHSNPQRDPSDSTLTDWVAGRCTAKIGKDIPCPCQEHVAALPDTSTIQTATLSEAQ